jgi:hypothetical protein
MNSSGTVKSSVKIASGLNGGPTLADSDVFGFSLAPLGDLDGDGVVDLAVGTAFDDTGGTDRGAVHVLLLNPTGTVKSTVKLASNTNGGPSLANGNDFGASVASLGDLDGDGVVDLAVGADRDNAGGTFTGAVYVLLLNHDGTAKSNLKIANNTNGGPTLSNSELFGDAIASLGDLDGDGITDLAVGAQGNGSGGTLRGAVYVLLLNASGSVKTSVKIASNTNGGPVLPDVSRFGTGVVSLGDLDGDGVIDLAVGAAGDSTGGDSYTERGAVHILFMNSNGTVKSSMKIASGLNGAPSLADNDSFGSSIAVLGDMDGDGITDLAVGAQGDQTGGSPRGAVHILFLNARPNPDFGDAPDTGPGAGPGNYATSLADNGPRHDISATQTTLFLGARVGGEADAAPHALANGDDLGIDDEDGVIEPGQDLDFTVGSRPVVRLHATNTTGTLALLYGWIDFNQDGVFDDARERAYTGVLNGTTNGIVKITFPTIPANTPPGRTYARFRLSTSTAATGSANGPISDGEVEDYPATIRLRSDGTINGSQYVKLASGTNGAPTLADGDYFGTSVAALGDLDGDGISDIAVGANRDHTGGMNRGAAYVLFLNSDGTVKSNVEIASGLNGGPILTDGEIFGGAVAAVGDLDGDGITELAVGATGPTAGSFYRGAVYLLFLNTNGTVKSSVKIANGLNGGPTGDSDAFGSGIASIGDLDGDGVPDLAVGAFLSDAAGPTDAGAIYVLLLNRSGTVKSSVRILPSDFGEPRAANLGYFGISITSLGDLDNDGVTDLAVGADGTTLSQPAGAAYVLRLNANGTLKSATNLTTVGTLNLANRDYFGSSVASLGDLDGDGVTDLAVGAMLDDTSSNDYGAVHVLRMNANGTVKSSMKLASGVNGVPLRFTGGHFGNAVVPIGDINGDGFVDLAVGAFDDNTSGTGRGAVHILFMQAADVRPPSVVSITRQDPATQVTIAAEVVFRVTFDEGVQNVDLSDFRVHGATTAFIGSVDRIFPHVYDVMIYGGDLGTFNGEVGLDIATAQNIRDYIGNALSANDPPIDETYTLDHLAPLVDSFTRLNPLASVTAAATLVWQVRFSEGVQNVDAADFRVTGGSTATIASVVSIDARTYEVGVSGGDLATFDGVLHLDISFVQNVSDLVGNALVRVEPPIDETYKVDRLPPRVTGFRRQAPTDSWTNAAELVYRVTFNDAVTGVDAADFVIGGGSTASIQAVTQVTPNSFDLTVSGGNFATFGGLVYLNLAPAPNIVDLVGHPLVADEPIVGENYVVDHYAPSLWWVLRQVPAAEVTSATSVTFNIRFLEDVQDVDADDFVVAGGTTAGITNVTTADNRNFTITISGGDLATFNGALQLDLSPTRNLHDLAGNIASAVKPANEQSYIIDHEPPRLISFTRQVPLVAATAADVLIFRATFSEAVFGVDAMDFALTGTTANISQIALVGPGVYDLTLSGGNLASLNGVVGIDLSSPHNLRDVVGYDLPTAEPAIDETYQVDNTSPTVTSNRSVSQPNRTAGAEVRFRVLFSEPVNGFTVEDLDFTGSTAGGTLAAAINGAGAEYEVAVSGMTSTGYVQLSVKAGAATDAAGNTSQASTSSSNQVLWYSSAPLQLATTDVLELQAGAIVGPVSVPGAPPDRPWTVTIDDPRFEIADGVLRLKSGESVAREADATIPLLLTFSDGPTVVIDQTITLNVPANTFPSHNAPRPEDTDGDGDRDIGDAIFLIRELRRGGGGLLPLPKPAALYGGSYFDVDANGQFNIQDALGVIRYLRRNRAGGEGEATGVAQNPPRPLSSDQSFTPLAADLVLLNWWNNEERKGK